MTRQANLVPDRAQQAITKRARLLIALRAFLSKLTLAFRVLVRASRSLCALKVPGLNRHGRVIHNKPRAASAEPQENESNSIAELIADTTPTPRPKSQTSSAAASAARDDYLSH
jgi:hypothetical protein